MWPPKHGSVFFFKTPLTNLVSPSCSQTMLLKFYSCTTFQYWPPTAASYRAWPTQRNEFPFLHSQAWLSWCQAVAHVWEDQTAGTGSFGQLEQFVFTAKVFKTRRKFLSLLLQSCWPIASRRGKNLVACVCSLGVATYYWKWLRTVRGF